MYVKMYDATEECTVHMSKKLARLCKPYKGDPRGTCGGGGPSEDKSETEIIVQTLLKNGGNVLKGTSIDFVCIPQAEYEQLLSLLR